MTALRWALVAGIVGLLGCDPEPVIVGSDCVDCGADSGPTEGDGGSPGGDTDPDEPVSLVGAGGRPGPRTDASTPQLEGGQLDASAGQVDGGPLDGSYMCEPGFFDCDGLSSNGCEWDGCAMVVFLNLIACGMCGEVELCGCGPSVTVRDRCDIDCNGMGADD